MSGNIEFQDILSCAADVDFYLKDHLNWQRPIIPDTPGCPRISWDSTFFNKTDEEWVCSPGTIFKSIPLGLGGNVQ